MVMSIEGRFNDLGIDPVIAVKLMDLLNVSSDDFIDARRFERFKDVASYIGRFENYEYMIRKLTLTKNMDRLDHMWEWCQLSKQRQDIEKALKIFLLRARSLINCRHQVRGREVKANTKGFE